MNKSNVSIENPCHLKWQDLTPLANSKDRHCHECSLNIVDFTNMSNPEIIDYLAKRKGEKVCCAMRSKEEKSKVNSIVKGWNTKVKSNTKNGPFKAFLLFSIGLLMLTTGCDGDDDNEIYIGEPVAPEDSELNTETTAKSHDGLFAKIFGKTTKV